MRRSRLAALLALLAVAPWSAGGAAQTAPGPEEIAADVATDEAVQPDAAEADADPDAVRRAYQRQRRDLLSARAIRDAYEGRAWQSRYVTAGGLTPRGRVALEWLPSVLGHGVDADWLGLDAVGAELRIIGEAGTRGPAAAARLEIRIADALVRAADELRLANAANVPPGERHERWRTASLRTLLDAETDELQVLLTELAPRYPPYVASVAALERYRAIDAAGGWPTVESNVPDDAPVEQIALLRRRLAMEGYPVAADPDTGWDESLRAAVRRFQTAHQLTADGEVGRRTRAALNVPVRDRIAALVLSLERLRRSPAGADGSATAVRVNVEGQYVEYWEGDRRLYRARAIVGRTEPDGNRENYTPIFSDQMERLEFNPFWYPPPRLERELHEDPEQGIIRRGGHLIQVPGPLNRLGQVKFLFPNSFDVYLHDTPLPELFDRPIRGYSSGCIRAENPLDLATLLVAGDRRQDPHEVRAWIDAIVQTDATEVVPLETPIAVHIEYYPAAVADDGITEFFVDLYERDTRALREARRRDLSWEPD